MNTQTPIPDTQRVFLEEYAAAGVTIRAAVNAYKRRFDITLFKAANHAVRVYVAQAVAGNQGALSVVTASAVCHDYCARRGIDLPFIEGIADENGLVGTYPNNPGYGTDNNLP